MAMRQAEIARPPRAGSTYDKAEREADRVATLLTAPGPDSAWDCPACTAAAQPCAACEAGARNLRRSALGPAVPNVPASVQRGLSGGGAPLPQPIRSRFEKRLGGGLGDVRLHQGPAAAQAARSVRATAFALGRDIAWGAAAPAPQDPAGEFLLAHEVAHVALGHTGLRRWDPPTPVSSVATLSNADLLTEIVTSREGGDPTYRAELDAERERRVGLGHRWMTADLGRTPADLVQLLPAGGPETAVVIADPAVAMGPPIDLGDRPIMTRGQFQARLLAEGIPTMTASALTAAASTAAPRATPAPTVRPPPGPGVPASAPFVIMDPSTAPAGMRTVEVRVPLAWQLASTPEIFGTAPSDIAPELLARMRAGTLTQAELASLLARPMNADDSLRSLIAFEHGEPRGLGSDSFVRTRFGAEHGFVFSEEGSGGVGRALLGERMVRALREGLPAMQLEVGDSPRAAPGAAHAEPGAPTAVERFHASIHETLGRSGEAPRAGARYWLSPAEMARLALTFGGASTPAETALLNRIAGGDGAAVGELRALPRPLSPAEMVHIARLQSLSGGGGMGGIFTDRMASPLTPEWSATQRFGALGAGGRAVGTGAGFGSLLGLGLDATMTAGGDGDWSAFADRAPRTLTLGATGGGVGMGMEQALVGRSSSAMIASGTMPGIASGARLLGARVVGGGVGAGVAELVLIYGFEDRPHEPAEVVGRVGRSTGIGVVSAGVGTAAAAGTVSLIGAILATGGTGAAAGTVVPGWGNVIGGAIGIGAGILTYVILDEALPRVEP